jgi:Domain of unknown function (DUF4136)
MKVFKKLIPLMLLAVTAFGQTVKSDYDRSADFAKYKTYSWKSVSTKDQLLVDRIKSAVDGQLAAKGLTQVPSGGDISLVAIEATKNQESLNTFYDGFGGGWRWGGFGNSYTTVDNYKVGTLVVDMFDTQTKKLIWRGSASDVLSNKSDKNIKNLDKGVQKMLKHFPPEAKK